MLLMERIYETLAEYDNVLTAEDFSVEWCGMSRSWYAERRHKGRDLSVKASIRCLNKLAVRRAVYLMGRRKFGTLRDAEIDALGELQQAIRDYLAEQHGITESALSAGPQTRMLGN